MPPLVRLAADVPRLELHVVEVQQGLEAAHPAHEVGVASGEVRQHRHHCLVVAVEADDFPAQLAKKSQHCLEDCLELQRRVGVQFGLGQTPPHLPPVPLACKRLEGVCITRGRRRPASRVRFTFAPQLRFTAKTKCKSRSYSLAASTAK
ncbi:hypothetical protein CYMTET_19767 [Cymbomonas tetramitiformis]|uniref:Uncharacterized protein n=1 Tax=Cymbomonas tetramitiformis TaxID=36881 RepID=A0AAE0L4M4_9CHLO|nr:hypothetical protein CYMTET_19767 [Cymbomonas tetramitiformis]